MNQDTKVMSQANLFYKRRDPGAQTHRLSQQTLFVSDEYFWLDEL